MRLQRSAMQLPSCKKGSEPCGARASRSGAPAVNKRTGTRPSKIGRVPSQFPYLV
ncbi:hypothetical protein FOFC_21127 [Fusarium oxysporum]|nr:hypothetical protein FOFC_21127 [Fusarium oxysporum]